MALLDDVADRFGLGRVLDGAFDVHGGVNVVTRLPTTTGTYAVHQLLAQPPLAAVEGILAIEAIAEAGGVALAAPVGCGAFDGAAGPVMVHLWIDADPVDLAAPGPGFVTSLGRSLGRLHAVAPDASELDGLFRRGAQPVYDLLDRWEAAADGRRVRSHRDLTPANVLDRSGEAVLIDWESAGPVGVGAEIGRTALDHDLSGADLIAFLDGYTEASPLPTVGPDWISLWVRALLAFDVHCRASLAAGVDPPSLRAFQQRVVDTTPAEAARRLALVDDLVDRFREAAAAV